VKRLFELARRRPEAEVCELCAQAIGPRHDHLYEPDARSVRCACEACLILLGSNQRYRRIPRRRQPIALTAELHFPVGLAALVRRDDGTCIVVYPGPAGAVESELAPEEWEALAPELPPLVPEVEAVIWSRLDGGNDAWITGIDVVFRMIAEVRAAWTGMTGGPEAALAVARVLAELRAG
jgi:hypothetical protein